MLDKETPYAHLTRPPRRCVTTRVRHLQGLIMIGTDRIIVLHLAPIAGMARLGNSAWTTGLQCTAIQCCGPLFFAEVVRDIGPGVPDGLWADM